MFAALLGGVALAQQSADRGARVGGSAISLATKYLGRAKAAEADRDKYLAAFSEQFDQREEYAAECKRLWRMESRIEALAAEWANTERSIGCLNAAHRLRGALGEQGTTSAEEIR